MQTTLITNARMVNDGEIREGDVLIKNGRIENIAPSLPGEADQIIDAQGKALLPGMIDCHVHFREPGLEVKADMHSESGAAVAGGVTWIDARLAGSAIDSRLILLVFGGMGWTCG